MSSKESDPDTTNAMWRWRFGPVTGDCRREVGVSHAMAARWYGNRVLNISLSVITANVLITAGLLCVALHLAGVGNAVRVRGYTRRR